MTAATEKPYRERLWPAWWVLLLLAATVLMIAIAYGAAVSPAWGWVVGVAGAALSVAVIVATSPLLEVSDDGLRWAHVHIPHDYLGNATMPTHGEIRDVMTLRDPTIRPFLAIRTWATAQAILIEVADVDDPHTHLIVSTRNAQRLTSALGRYRVK